MPIITLTPHRLKRQLLISALAFTSPFSVVLAQDSEPAALQALLKQAEFWEENQRPDLARQTLERYLAGRPDDPEVLYRLARQALSNNETSQAEQWMSRLQAAAPNSAYLVELEQQRQQKTLNPGQLSRARQLAQANRYAEAIAAYRQLFEGPVPPRGIALEYYQTLAGGGDDDWRQARDGLRQLVSSAPTDDELARTYGEVLTYREGTRRDGIERLAGLTQGGAGSAEQANTAWRQALLWLDATPADEALYQAYAQANPDDSAVAQHFSESTAENSQAAGYDALEEGQLGDAETLFRQALEDDPQDAEAMAGLGLLLLRRQQFAQSRDMLESALKLSPERRSEWGGALQSASFYARLNDAQRLAQANQLEQALNQVRPLAQQGGNAGRAARLLEADILRRQGRLDTAEQRYRSLLETRANDTQAKVGLVQVLSDKGDWSEAQRVAQTLPESTRAQISGLASRQVEALRSEARQQDPFGAEVKLRQALELDPGNPWARLDLARLLVRQSQLREATALMASFEQPSASADQRYAAALFASEQSRWGEAKRLLSSIASKDMTPEMRALQQQADIQQPLMQALAQLKQGQRSAALESLRQLYQRSGQDELSPGQVSQIADALQQAGAQDEAVRWIERDIARGIEEQAPNDYINHVLILAQAGNPRSARQLLSRLTASPQWREDADALAAERGLAVIDADQLRQRGQLASAYDRLAQPLRTSPNDEALLLAMARVYTDGKRREQAEQIYTYALTQHPDSQQALTGAVQSALANNRLRQASQMLSRYSPPQPTADLWLLRAEVARAEGDGREALALLRRARQSLSSDETGVMMLAQNGNPFVNEDTAARPAGTQRPRWLPGNSSERADNAASVDPVREVPLTTAQRIDALARDIRHERAPRIITDFALNLRDGEQGLSQQDRIETSIGFSAVPFGNGRTEITVTPTVLASGKPQGEALNRFGRSGLAQSAIALDGSLAGITPILDSLQTSVSDYFTAQERLQTAPNEQEQVRLTAELEAAQRRYESALERNPLYEAGLTVADLTPEQRTLFNRVVLDNSVDFEALSLDGSSREAFLASRQQLEEAIQGISTRLQAFANRGQPSSIRDSGAGLSLSYENGGLAMDAGSTPLGFEETNLVGGISWQPQLTDHVSLSLNAERRAIKDSVLSYAGAYDTYGGDSWGGVVRTGGSAGVNYDTAAGGLYADVGSYRYTGHNVADNKSYEVSLGGYARPVDNDRRQLQAGVHVSGMAFDDDLSHFTYGHGGYFSPQEYVSVAFPINYRENVSDKLTLGGYLSPGFQSYSTDDSDYFPTDSESQALLDVFTALGAMPASRYEGDSQSGMGLSVGGAVEYQMSPDMSLGGRVDFNSFGDYNDTSANVFMNYTFGDSGERAR